MKKQKKTQNAVNCLCIIIMLAAVIGFFWLAVYSDPYRERLTGAEIKANIAENPFSAAHQKAIEKASCDKFVEDRTGCEGLYKPRTQKSLKETMDSIFIAKD